MRKNTLIEWLKPKVYMLPVLMVCAPLPLVGAGQGAPGWNEGASTNAGGENLLELSSHLAPEETTAVFHAASAAAQPKPVAARPGTARAENKLELDAEGASGRFGSYSAGFLGDAFGGVWLATPGGTALQSRVVGLFYFSEDGRSQMICGLKNSAGELHGDAAVMYPKR